MKSRVLSTARVRTIVSKVSAIALSYLACVTFAVSRVALPDCASAIANAVVFISQDALFKTFTDRDTVVAYLQQHDLEYADNMSLAYLKGVAKRHALEVAGESVTPAKKQKMRGANVDTCITVSQLVRMLKRINSQAAPFNKHYAVKFTIEAIDKELIRISHMVGSGTNKCYGNIYDGKCSRCAAVTIGVAVYSFTLTIADLAEIDAEIDVKIGADGAESLLGMDAATWVAVADSEKTDKVRKEIMFATMTGTVSIKKDKDDFCMLHLYNFKHIDPTVA